MFRSKLILKERLKSTNLVLYRNKVYWKAKNTLYSPNNILMNNYLIVMEEFYFLIRSFQLVLAIYGPQATFFHIFCIYMH